MNGSRCTESVWGDGCPSHTRCIATVIGCPGIKKNMEQVSDGITTTKQCEEGK